ncbi:MAG TPA: AMP-binding protein [Pseudonocardiaceae bacterium]|jgi:fatty-acyl-CoA synthase|nr:AMP-binding protein [Pseudonocardiaceae bacterium]
MSNEPVRGGDNLWDLLMGGAAGSRSSALHCWTGDGFDTASWTEVVRDAETMTAGLRRAGIRPGTRVATILTNNPHAVRGMLGVWLAGGAIASLPVPARGMDHMEYAQQLRTICEQLQPAAFLVEEGMLGLLPDELRSRLNACSWQSFVGSGRVDSSPPEDEELAFIQYSSGSTSTPKGCMLTPRAIAAQIELVTEMIEGRPGREVTVSWLPLSHDMGMFGCLLTSWANDFELYLSTPERFMMSARTWFGDMARVGATLTAGTNTALHLAARAHRSVGPPAALQTRVCIIGAERVEWDTLRLVTEVLGPYGLRAQTLMPGYGLAEATLAVTATPAPEPPRYLVLDATALAHGDLQEAAPNSPSATGIVSAGLPCRGVELPGSTTSLAEINVRSRCLATGYLGDEQRTRACFRDGTVATGDLGFVRDGYLYPVGRIDDIISVGGRKVYAHEVENAVDLLDGARRGCSTLVARYAGKLRFTLLVELKVGGCDYQALAEQAAALTMAKAAIALDECVFLERNSLPKTPSGKIQRHRCRQMLDAGRFESLATIELAGGMR